VRLLLDTPALIWWLEDDPSLGNRARAVIADTQTTVFVSAASAWEISIKFRLGKLPNMGHLVENFAAEIELEKFQSLPISIDHALRAGLLPGLHKDPFDRMLIAQCLAENLALVSNEQLFDRYAVRRIW
jgi:PIN domain nuclease of toxin-antitoxin system